jgi:ketosteroid isomerase-like protein
MPTSSHPPHALAALSPPVAAYVEATNNFDLERLLTLFADDALVNDQLRDYWGKPAIRQWAARDIVAQSLTMEVTTVIEHYGNFIVTANVRGKFDMTGLPDPLVYAFYFAPHGDRIVQLIILRNRYDV